MSMSAIDKIDALGTKSSPNKAMSSDFSSYYGYGAYIPSGDLPRDEYGAAAAYAVMAEVFAALAVWEANLDGVTWIVKDKSTGAEIARTDVQEYPLNERGGKWYNAIRQHERRYYHSYFKSLAYSDWLFGKSYIAMLEAEKQFRPTSTNYTGVKWLNPLNTHAMTISGRIEYFQYTGMDADGYTQIFPNAMAYRINRRNSFDDLDGYSGVMAAMDAINLSRNSLRAFKNFFSQGMQLGGVIMPKDGDTWSNVEHEAARREWEHNHKGTANSGRWAILRRFANITPYGQEDVSQNFTVTKDLRNTIFMALNVPPQLAGDPSDATYDNADDIRRQWLQLFFIPYVKDIAGFNSEVVIPKLEPSAGVYIEADLSPYQIEAPEVISQDVGAGIVDLDTAATKRGYPSNDKLKGVYLINNVPMHEDVIAELSRKIPSQYALDYANAQAAGQAPSVNADMVATVKPIESPATPETQAGSEIISPYLTKEKKSVEGIPTLDDGSPIVEAPLPATLNSAHDGIPDDIHHSHGLERGVVSRIVVTPDNTSELEELATWRKFCMNGKTSKRAFEQKALRGDIGDLIQLAIESHDKQTILDGFRLAQERIEKRIKAIQATRLDFENDFDNLLKRARAEKMGRVQWASAMRSIIRRFGTRAYIDGLADAGVEDEPSEEDMIEINRLIGDNSQYVTELGNVLYKEDGISDAQADVKASMWYNKTIEGFYQAGMLSGNQNMLVEWVYGDTIQHCPDCSAMNGQRHRLKWFKARKMPKSQELSCEGYQCDCNLKPVRGKSRDKAQ